MDNSKQSANTASQRKAHWIINCDGYYPVCSNCGKEPPYRTMTDYCPCCGAYMGRGRDEEKESE